MSAGAPIVRRRATIAAIPAAVWILLGLAAAAHGGSQTTRQYYDGVIAWTSHTAWCITGSVEYMTGQYVGYYGTSDVSWPRVGDVFYGRIVMSTVGAICPGEGYVEPEITLPPNTQLAISAENRIYCYMQLPGQSWQEVTPQGGCPTGATYPSYSGYGTYSFFATRSPYWWPLPQGAYLDIRVPMVASQPMSGIATNSYLRGYVEDAGTAQISSSNIGVFVAANDLIFADGFESGGLSSWSSSATDGGNLSVLTAAAMRGSTKGIRAFVNDTNSLYVQDDRPTDQGRYRARFWFSPNGFDPGEASGAHRVRVFLGFDATPQKRMIAIVLKRQSGAYSLMARIRRDDGTTADTPFYSISAAPHSIEMDWKRSTSPGANNGTFKLWIDDVLQASLAGIDDDAGGIDFARMGAMNVKAGASGTLWYDEFESRSATAIGP